MRLHEVTKQHILYLPVNHVIGHNDLLKPATSFTKGGLQRGKHEKYLVSY